MQVSETHDHVNHAIIGGQASIEMGISTSAEFFNILSTTLYRDQMLAVVREVLCNAWDSHIESGIRDTPISIIITNERFIVSDFGKAIHHDDMGPIYGVYGNSTKKNDGTQTGGFGLGCKSPFAYTDHFEVTSCHEGVKTIYRLSKAAVQSGGKPAIIPIASFPTTETGLTVKIDLKSFSDKTRFLQLAQRIVFNGEMLATINGTVHKKLGFDHTVRSYHVYRDLTLLDNTQTIAIRYGNVVYPMESNKDLSGLCQEIHDFLAKLKTNSYGNGGYSILFQAPPHSLSVTPSRESLSMQEHTVKTLKGLFESFLSEMRANFQTECDNFAQAAIEQAVKEKSFKTLLSRQPHLPIVTEVKNIPVLTDFKAMAEQYMTSTYPKDLAFRKADWKCRIMLMSESKLIDRGMAQTWLKEADKVVNLGDEYYYNRNSHDDYPWLGRRILAPLIGKLNMDPNMDASKLYIIDTDDVGSRSQGRDPGMILAKNVHVKHQFNTASYLRNIIVIAKRKHEIHSRCVEHDVFTKFGKTTGYLFYHVGLKASDAEAARAFFAKTGMNVVDMIDRQDWEEEPNYPSYTPAEKADRKPRNKGLVMVKSLTSKYGRVDTSNFELESNERMEKPEYVIRIYIGTRNNSTSQLQFLDGDQAQVFAELFGDRGAVSVNETQYNNYIKKGARTLQDFLLDEVSSYFNANLVEIKNWWSANPNKIVDNQKTMGRLNYEQQQLLEAIYKIPELAAHYQVTALVTDTSRKYIRLYDRLVSKGNYADHPVFLALKKEMDKISLNSQNDALLKKISGAKLVKMLDADDLHGVYSNLKGKPTQLATFVSIVTTILDS